MAYRDDGEVARLRLVELERQVATRAESRPLLRQYRRALRREVARLEHACLWYANGRRRGFNSLPARDDLSRSAPPQLLPTSHPGGDTAATLDAATAMNRVGALMRRLEGDPLQRSIATLRARAVELRTQLAFDVRCDPLAPPPPPAFLATPLSVVLAIGGATVGSFLVVFLVAFAALASWRDIF